MGFTWKKIASLLGVSERALRYKKHEFQLFMKYTVIGVSHLDYIIRDIFQTLPNSGERMMTGALLARGYKLQRKLIRESMNRVNPTSPIPILSTFPRISTFAVLVVIEADCEGRHGLSMRD